MQVIKNNVQMAMSVAGQEYKVRNTESKMLGGNIQETHKKLTTRAAKGTERI